MFDSLIPIHLSRLQKRVSFLSQIFRVVTKDYFDYFTKLIRVKMVRRVTNNGILSINV